MLGKHYQARCLKSTRNPKVFSMVRFWTSSWAHCIIAVSELLYPFWSCFSVLSGFSWVSRLPELWHMTYLSSTGQVGSHSFAPVNVERGAIETHCYCCATQNGFAKKVSWTSVKWAEGQPDNTNGNEKCGFVRETGLIGDEDCLHPLPFFCSEFYFCFK